MKVLGLSLCLLILSLEPASGGIPVPGILDAEALKDGRPGVSRVEPCRNFYQFACGNWIDRTKIPSDRSVIFRQSAALSENTDEALGELLMEYSAGEGRVPSRHASLLGDHFDSCMNVEAHSLLQKETFERELQAVVAIRNGAELAHQVARLHLLGVNAFFAFHSGQDLKDSSRVIGFAAQGGFSLPEKDYYLRKDSRSRAIQREYRAHIARTLKLTGLGRKRAAEGARIIYEIEYSLAEKALSQDDQWDPEQTHHPVGVEGLKTLLPEFSWDEYFTALGLPELPGVNVTEPAFYSRLNEILKKRKLEDLKVYLHWSLANRSAEFLGERFAKADFEFWEKFLRGQKVREPLWKRCTAEIQNHLGYALAEAYVGMIDSDRIREGVEEMIRQVRSAFEDDLHQITHGPDAWMDPMTMRKALEKLELLRQKVGAPERWRDYSGLAVSRVSFLENSFRISEFESRRDLLKIGQPVDRDEWYMMPWEINAYYDPSSNEFVFPFGILQPPSLDLSASEGANLGAFGGGTIGHELTHGWDDDGRKYDGRGNVSDWWTAETRKKFEERRACFVKQANAFPVFVGRAKFFVNGEATISENLADQGGVKLGYAALEKQLESRSAASAWLGRYSERQQYWIAYAQSWCAKRTEKNMRYQVTADEHAPEEFRVNGTLMNRPEFARDFGCRDGDVMVPRERCSIW